MHTRLIIENILTLLLFAVIVIYAPGLWKGMAGLVFLNLNM